MIIYICICHAKTYAYIWEVLYDQPLNEHITIVSIGPILRVQVLWFFFEVEEAGNDSIRLESNCLVGLMTTRCKGILQMIKDFKGIENIFQL